MSSDSQTSSGCAVEVFIYTAIAVALLLLFFLFVSGVLLSPEDSPGDSLDQVDWKQSCFDTYPGHYWVGAYELVDGNPGRLILSVCSADTQTYQVDSPSDAVVWAMCPPPNGQIEFTSLSEIPTTVAGGCFMSIRFDNHPVTLGLAP